MNTPRRLTLDRPRKYNAKAMAINLKTTLSRTRRAFKDKFDEILNSHKDRNIILDELTETLLLADVSYTAAEKIIARVKKNLKNSGPPETIRTLFAEEIRSLLSISPGRLNIDPPPSVIMFVGANGGGKTTSLAKLAYSLKQSGRSVMLAAADTFRAAAQEQLTIWGKRLNVPVIKGQYGADPASVTFDALHSFRTKGYDVLLVDTAGRVHTNANLMNEVEKIKKVIAREIAGAPQEILLVLDAGIGQNALYQAREFLKFSGLSGIFLSKLDGSAKGGCVISIIDELELPIKFIGVGENEEDMLPFSPEEFTHALLQ